MKFDDEEKTCNEKNIFRIRPTKRKITRVENLVELLELLIHRGRVSVYHVERKNARKNS